MTDEEPETDRFGLPYMETETEVAISFVLLVCGLLIVGSTIWTLRAHADMTAGWLGVIMLGTAYFFVLESVRELEEEDHYLSRKIGKKE